MSPDESAGTIIGFVCTGFFVVACWGYAIFTGLKLQALEERVNMLEKHPKLNKEDDE